MGSPRRRSGRKPRPAFPQKTCARSPANGEEARLPRARRLGQRPWRRLPQPDRHPVGPRHGVPRRHAGARQARRQHGQSAMGLPARLQFLFPRLCRRRHVRRLGKHLDAGRALPAHAAAPDHRIDLPAHPANLACRRRSPTGRPRAMPGSASRSSTSSPSSPIRRRATRRSRCSTSTAGRCSRP